MLSTIALSLSPPILSAMLSRVRNSRGRPKNAPAAFIVPCPHRRQLASVRAGLGA
jgi:hypothetical protein